jgi:hypothetical protein
VIRHAGIARRQENQPSGDALAAPQTIEQALKLLKAPAPLMGLLPDLASRLSCARKALQGGHGSGVEPYRRSVSMRHLSWKLCGLCLSKAP